MSHGAIPIRIRGKVGQITEHEEEPNKIGKWAFEISFWDADATVKHKEMTITGDKDNKPFETEAEAQFALKIAAEICVKEAQKITGGPVTGEHFDMLKGGLLKSFKEGEH